MILVLDVGNTNITFGAYEEEKLVTTFRMTTKVQRTSDEYGIVIRDLLHMNGVKRTDIEGSIVASVVPNVMHSLTSAMIRYIGTNPWFRECVDFTTPPETGDRVAVGLWIWDAAGEAWFDDVRLEEQP